MLAPAVATLIATAGAALAQSPFATRVVAYDPAPGQSINDPLFNAPSRALGPPVGGGRSAPDNTKLVTLGAFGGSITLGFDHTIPNLAPSAGNPLGLDAIVFGNAFYPGNDPMRRWAEAAVIEVSLDVDHNSLADDPWYLIPGSHIALPPQRAHRTYQPGSIPPAWFPAGWAAHGFDAYALPTAVFAPSGYALLAAAGPEDEAAWGYGDCTPVLVRGDLGGDDAAEVPNIDPAIYYTKPDDPRRVGITPRSCGGDAFDVSWAVNTLGAPANLTGFDFIRITSAIDTWSPGPLGEVSAEVGGVAEVRPWLLADLATAGNPDPDAGPDGYITGEDFDLFIIAFFTERRDSAGHLIADIATAGSGAPLPDGFVTGEDFDLFVVAYFTGQ